MKISGVILIVVFLIAATIIQKFVDRRNAETARKEKADHENQMRSWRAAWEPTIDRSRWIAAGTARRILTAYPAPTNALGTGSTVTENQLRDEFAGHNRRHLERQKQVLRGFFETLEANPLTDGRSKPVSAWTSTSRSSRPLDPAKRRPWSPRLATS